MVPEGIRVKSSKRDGEHTPHSLSTGHSSSSGNRSWSRGRCSSAGALGRGVGLPRGVEGLGELPEEGLEELPGAW